MGRSHTYHVVGQTREKDGRVEEVAAMSRLEIAQLRACRIKEGREPIAWWWSQTLTGARILGGLEPVADAKIPRAKGVITCPACGGATCHICRRSGITTAAHAAGYCTWQIEAVRESIAKGERG